MIGKLLHWCRGFVRLEVQGAALERFVNICRVHGVRLWEIERPSPDLLRVSMEKGDWALIGPMTHRTMCTAEVLWEDGMKRSLAPLRRRYCLVAAALLCVTLCWLSGQFLWVIRIEGCSRISQRELYDQLRSVGLTPGMPMAAIDERAIRGELMTLRDDLTFLTINLRGTVAEVTVTEKDPERQMGEAGQPCDIYADKAGIVEDLQVLDGTAIVKIGDTVIPGDLLVSGTMTSTQGETRQVESKANITLRTWRTVETGLHPQIYGTIETGETFSRWSLIIGSRRFELPCIEKNNYACYYKTMETTAVSLGEGYFFPLTLVREIWHECTAAPLDLSREACGELLHTSCRTLLDGQCVEGGVTETAYELIFEENRIVGRLQAECLEETGTKTPITGEH